MGLLDRLGLRRPVQLAAAPIAGRALTQYQARLTDPAQRKRTMQVKADDWQRRAWDMFNTIGLVHYPYSQTADAAARCRLYLGIEASPGGEVTPIDQAAADPAFAGMGVTDRFVADAGALFDRVQSLEGGRGEIQREGVLNLKVAGDLALIAEETDLGEDFYVVSTAALKSERKGRNPDGTDRVVYSVLENRSDRKGRELNPERSSIYRIWRRHGEFPKVADSNMRALLDDCELLLMLKAGNLAHAQNRVVNTGFVMLDKRVKFEGGAFNAETLGRLFSAAISDPSSGSAVVPPVLEFDGDALPGGVKDAIAHVTMDRPFTKDEIEKFRETVLSIARGIDAPPEYVLGLGDTSTYANARLIAEENYNAHLAPTVGILADGLAAAWQRPGLTEMGYPPDLVRRVVVAVDPGSILARPTPVVSTDAGVTLYDAQLATKNEIRAEYGWPMIDGGDEFAPEAVIADPPPDDDGSPDNPNADDEDMAIAASTLAIEAAAVPVNPYADLGPALGQIDRQLFDRCLVLCSAALDAALNQASARLRSEASRQKVPGWDRKRSVPARQVAATLGPQVVKALLADAADDPLSNLEAFDELRGKWDSTVANAQRRADRAVLAYNEGFDADPLAAQRDDERDKSWGYLLGALGSIAAQRLLSPAIVEPPNGEYDSTLSLPAGTVRDALRVAGGGSPAAVVQEGLVATGPTTMDVASAALDARGDTWMWTTGGPTRPFEPHQELDGTVFDEWDDPRLANSEGWPPGDYFEPGDHPGCVCLAVPILAPADLALAATGAPSTMETDL